MAVLRVKVVPNASKRQIIIEGDIIKIKLISPPQNGKANKELKEFLSKKLNIPKKSIDIISGRRSREKHINIESLSLEEILVRLREH